MAIEVAFKYQDYNRDVVEEGNSQQHTTEELFRAHVSAPLLSISFTKS